jgi:hypothetical protein
MCRARIDNPRGLSAFIIMVLDVRIVSPFVFFFVVALGRIPWALFWKLLPAFLFRMGVLEVAKATVEAFFTRSFALSSSGRISSGILSGILPGMGARMRVGIRARIALSLGSRCSFVSPILGATISPRQLLFLLLALLLLL